MPRPLTEKQKERVEEKRKQLLAKGWNAADFCYKTRACINEDERRQYQQRILEEAETADYQLLADVVQSSRSILLFWRKRLNLPINKVYCMRDIAMETNCYFQKAGSGCRASGTISLGIRKEEKARIPTTNQS
jgi:hypothetical protein